MGIKDCIKAAAKDGHINRQHAKEFIDRFEQVEQATPRNERGSDFETRVAQALQEQIERESRRKKRQNQIQANINDRHTKRIQNAPKGKKEKAAKSILTFDATNQNKGPNVFSRYLSVRGEALAEAEEFIHKFKTTKAGFSQDLTGLEDVVRGLHGESTTIQGEAIAKGLIEAREMMRVRMNAAGADIMEREDFGWHQSHSAVNMQTAGKEQWLTDILPLLDKSKMFDGAGRPLTRDGQVMEIADFIYDQVASNNIDAPKGGHLGQRVGHRTLVFKDADSWMTYQKKYGSQDLYSTFINELDRMAKDTAVFEVLGPQPNAALRNIQDLLGGEKKSSVVNVENLYDELMGATDPFSDGVTAKLFQANRNLVTAARLGSSVFIALGGDSVTANLTAKLNGMSSTRLMKRWAKHMNPANDADRRLAARLGYVSENWVGNSLASQRLQGDTNALLKDGKVDQVTARSSQLADGVLRASGLSAWTEAGRQAFSLELIGHLTDMAGRGFDELPAPTRRMLNRYGVDRHDWDLYRSTNIWKDNETGAEFIRPDDVYKSVKDLDETLLKTGEKEARRQTTLRLQEMIRTEGHFAIVTPTPTSRAASRLGATRGSFIHEVGTKNLFLWKSFSMSFMHLHLSRVAGLIQNRDRSAVAYVGALSVGLTAAGALAIQASNIAQGKSFEDMEDQAFWNKAFARGGAFGFGNDLMEAIRRGDEGAIAEFISGPVFAGEGGKLIKAVSPATSSASSVRGLLEMLVPGSTLWYTRLAQDILIKDQIEKLIDEKGFKRKQRRKEKRMKDRGQTFLFN